MSHAHDCPFLFQTQVQYGRYGAYCTVEYLYCVVKYGTGTVSVSACLCLMVVFDFPTPVNQSVLTRLGTCVPVVVFD
jgi:hypothetical protein